MAVICSIAVRPASHRLGCPRPQSWDEVKQGRYRRGLHVLGLEGLLIATRAHLGPALVARADRRDSPRVAGLGDSPTPMSSTRGGRVGTLECGLPTQSAPVAVGPSTATCRRAAGGGSQSGGSQREAVREWRQSEGGSQIRIPRRPPIKEITVASRRDADSRLEFQRGRQPATMVAAARALASREDDPLIDDLAAPLVRAVGLDFFTGVVDGTVDRGRRHGGARCSST